MSRDQRKIKNIFVDTKFQLKYVFWLTASGLLLVLGIISVFYFYIKENYDLFVELSPMTDEAKALMYSELNVLILCLIFGGVLFLIATAICGIAFSHRVAGPIYHFQKVLNEYHQGLTSSRVRLRPNDEFQDLAIAINKVLDQRK